MPDEFSHDVFLSHSSKDKKIVRDLAERLKKDGIKVWFADWEIILAQFYYINWPLAGNRGQNQNTGKELQ